MGEVFEITKKLPTPLALYVFSSSKEVQQKVFNMIPSGGACINDTLLHISNLNLPFGGVGQSGVRALSWEGELFTFFDIPFCNEKVFLV